MSRRIVRRSIHFPPLENGLDYVESVVKHLAKPQPTSKDLKYAVLHLAAAIEVLLKARLVQEHWSLIFTDVNKADLVSFENGDFQSISASAALQRLKNVVGLTVSQGDVARVELVVKKRNQLQHHGLKDNRYAITAIATKALDFLLSFVADNLRSPDTVATVDRSLGKIRPQLSEITKLVEVRLSTISSHLDGVGIVVQCPECSQQALELGEICHCHFCLADLDAEEAAESYVEIILQQSHYVAIKEGGEWNLHTCFSCGRETLVGGVTVRDDKPDGEGQWVCFNEATRWEPRSLAGCTRCGQLMPVDDTLVCADCWASMTAD